MKIGMIFPPFSGPFGGERKILRLAGALSRLGNAVTIYTPKYDERCDYMLDDGVAIEETGFISHGSWETSNMIQPFFMMNLALKIKGDFDIIDAHNHPSLVSILLAKKFRKIRKTPVVYECNEPPRFLYDLKSTTLQELSNKRGKAFLFRVFSPLYQRLDITAMKYVDEIIVLSQFVREQVRTIYKRDSTVIWEGVDVERFKEDERREEIRELYKLDDSPVLITVNKLHHRKRIDILINAMPIILEKFPNTKALIVGDGPEKAKLESLVHELGLSSSVLLTGFVPGEILPRYYAASDIFVFTATREPLPGSPLEAMASGIPVILPREGGCLEFLRQFGDEMYVRPRDSQALANAICVLLKDESLRKEMSKKVRRFAEENLTWERVANQTLEAYRKTIKIGIRTCSED